MRCAASLRRGWRGQFTGEGTALTRNISSSPARHRNAEDSATPWRSWTLATERKRLVLARRPSALAPARMLLAQITQRSFQLDQIEVSDQMLAQALWHGGVQRSFRSRQVQRFRNHVAILRRIQLMGRRERMLAPHEVVRWYASIGCGLPAAPLDESTLSRLDLVVRQLNSASSGLRNAVESIARHHRDILIDPIVPSFNGILSRLLLQYHLVRCKLPLVLFSSDGVGEKQQSHPKFIGRLLILLTESFDRLIAGEDAAARSNGGQ
jgi:hypothetical protein